MKIIPNSIFKNGTKFSFWQRDTNNYWIILKYEYGKYLCRSDIDGRENYFTHEVLSESIRNGSRQIIV